MTYRTGNHWGVTIVRQGERTPEGHIVGPDQLVAVVVNGDQALAERIVELLNADKRCPHGHPRGERCGPCAFDRVFDKGFVLDSCTCDGYIQADPACPVHHGRRARGPKPPPIGPGCVCDSSGRTCPRHGTVI